MNPSGRLSPRGRVGPSDLRADSRRPWLRWPIPALDRGRLGPGSNTDRLTVMIIPYLEKELGKRFSGRHL